MRVQDDYHNTAIWRGSVDYLKWVGKSYKKWDLQPLSNPSNYLRGRVCTKSYFNSLSANPTKWPNILKQFVGKLSTNCLSVFNRFVGLAYKVQFLYLLYIPFILYRKKTMLNLKTLKNLIKWTFFEVSGSKVAFANFSSAKTSPYKWYFWNYSK